MHSDCWLVCRSCCGSLSQDLLLMNRAGSNSSMIWSPILNSSRSPSWAGGQLSLLAQASVSPSMQRSFTESKPGVGGSGGLDLTCMHACTPWLCADLLYALRAKQQQVGCIQQHCRWTCLLDLRHSLPVKCLESEVSQGMPHAVDCVTLCALLQTYLGLLQALCIMCIVTLRVSSLL